MTEQQPDIFISDQKQIAADWFRALRDQICSEFEAIEAEATGVQLGTCDIAGKFERKKWQRDGGGGGEMSVMKGRVFEKVGVNISTVFGEFSESFVKEMPNAGGSRNFFATGISLVAHMQSPLVPAVHMNTRFIVMGSGDGLYKAWDKSAEYESCKGTGNIGAKDHLRAERDVMGSELNQTSGFEANTKECTCQYMTEYEPCKNAKDHSRTESIRAWFGGGADLTPMYIDEEDSRMFHQAFKGACNIHDVNYYNKFKEECDKYFFLKHRNEPRGIGGIFYDYHNTGSFNNDFTFTQDVGKAFLNVYPQLVRKSMNKSWSEEQREHQLHRRGRYVEFNLLYDRGTRFGLMTGGNIEAILMSLPPIVKWG